MKKILLMLPLVFWLGCEDEGEETSGYDSKVVGSWDIIQFDIGNSSSIISNNIYISSNSGLVGGLLALNDWNFEDNGIISLNEVTNVMPDGTGEILYGEWETLSGKMKLYFEPIYFTNIENLPTNKDTVTYFNENLFQYNISGQTMNLTAGDTILVFEKN